MDPKDGAILWKEDLNHLDKLPEADREKVRREVLACCAFWVETYSVHAKWYGLANKAVKGTALTEEEEGRYREAAEAYRKYIPDMPLASAEVKDSKYARYTGGYVQTTFWNVEKDVFKDWSARRSALTKYGYNWNAWFGQSSFVGSAMPTPVSDGKFLYVNTGYNDAFCYDLDGKRVWSAWFGPQGASWGSYITSPVLVGDVLIVHGGEGQHSKLWYRGLNKKTGEKLWQYDYNQSRGASYIMPTPSVLSLPLGDTGKMVDCIWTGAGDVLRASDGKLLAEKLGCHGNARPAGVEGDVVILANGSADGGAGKAWTYPQGITAIRLKAEAEDKVTAELLWNKPEMPSVVTAHKGIVYAAMRGDLAAFDVEKGTELARLKKVMLPNHLLSVVGDHLFGLDDVGVCLVATLGKDMKLVAANRLGTRVYAKYDFFNQGAQPFFSGNRTFIRSYTDVYCIGNPEEAMRLSAAHGGE
jgi:hypothetical protein